MKQTLLILIAVLTSFMGAQAQSGNPSLVVTDMVLGGSMMEFCHQDVFFTIRNDGEDFSGSLEIRRIFNGFISQGLYNNCDRCGWVAPDGDYVSIASGETKVVAMKMYPFPQETDKSNLGAYAKWFGWETSDFKYYLAAIKNGNVQLIYNFPPDCFQEYADYGLQIDYTLGDGAYAADGSYCLDGKQLTVTMAVTNPSDKVFEDKVCLSVQAYDETKGWDLENCWAYAQDLCLAPGETKECVFCVAQDLIYESTDFFKKGKDYKMKVGYSVGRLGDNMLLSDDWHLYMDFWKMTNEDIRLKSTDGDLAGIHETLKGQNMQEPNSGVMYDLQGRRVKNPKPGLYIISGSQGARKSGIKVVVK